MPRYNSQLNNSLQLRGRIWHIYWNVPKSLRDNPLFRGKRIYAKTLQTADVHEARKMRDIIVKQFRGMVEIAATQASRRAFMENLADAKRAREAMLPLDTDSAFVANFAGEPVIERGDFNAVACNLPVEQEVERHAITLKEAAKRFIKEHEGKVDRAVSSRVKYATASLQRVVGSKDVKLKDVTSRQVTRWIKAIAKDYSDNTRSAYLAALNKMWHWCWEHEHVDGVSPFKGIKMERQGDEASYEPFEVDEVKRIVELATPEMMELARFGLITGCRLSELVNLKPANFLMVDGIHAFQISEGKTDAAARTIPLPVHLWQSLKGCVEEGMWQGTVESNGRKFSTLKTNAMGRSDGLKVFHSFRHMAATAYEREHIEERITSVLLGHKNKRGESMSYGLYSAGLAPKQYLEAVERMLNG